MSTPEKRYLVSIGSFASEKSALDRLEAARRSGFSGEIIDDANNPTMNIVAAIMCIGEAINHIVEVLSKQIEGLIEQVSAISEKIEARQTEPAQSAPAQAEPSNEKLKAFGAKLASARKKTWLVTKGCCVKDRSLQDICEKLGGRLVGTADEIHQGDLRGLPR